ncbi:tRNA 2-selenouridine(34) synthase MnmH [Clostridium sp.]|uniref:tRNA 2-selenouridine(34) synthase MnmH n=1 Tax=Clostridium sp. TaxID=1506 RepID=UPI003F2CAC1C
MVELSKTKDFKNIVVNDIRLIDVRAEVEFEKGAMLNSVNLPILTNEERHIIGICYKEKGNEEATRLGYEIVSGKKREDRIKRWVDYFNENKEAMIYCFRGGSRSTIAQRLIYEETGRDIVKIDGGYKVFRNFLIDSLEEKNIGAKALVLTGYTGSGKTIVLNKVKNSIDLEGLANHRGSAFGHFVTSQPTQINFENNLAYNVIKHKDKGYNYMILEDEGKNIGKNFIPSSFYNYFHNGDLIFLETPLEERIENILNDYVINDQRKNIDSLNNEELGLEAWFNNIISNVEKVKSKLGGDRQKLLMEEFKKAYNMQIKASSLDGYRSWIELFLTNYYDPMYNHSINKSNRNIVFKGNNLEILEYLKDLEAKMIV